MIISQLNGGLGNQMFQYACGFTVAKKLDTPFFYYHISDDNNTSRSLELDCFTTTAFKLEQRKIPIIERQRKIQTLFSKYVMQQLPFLPTVLTEKKLDYNRSIVNVKNDTILVGYWQSEKYFLKMKNAIKKEFTFKKELDQKNKKYSSLIQTSDSVSIHIRRGDYITNKAAAAFHGSPSLSYYSKAIQLIKNRYHSPTFFVFSDDLEWARENLKITDNVYYVNTNTKPDQAYKDMQLMSYCKHNIIANSSFSWWGAWLNINTDKIVIAPKHWFKDKPVILSDRFPLSWITL